MLSKITPEGTPFQIGMAVFNLFVTFWLSFWYYYSMGIPQKINDMQSEDVFSSFAGKSLKTMKGCFLQCI
jgi:hypothetical protein